VTQTAAAEHRLDDVAQPRDAEPEKRAEPGHDPPAVDRCEGGGGHGETGQNFERVFERGIAIAERRAKRGLAGPHLGQKSVAGLGLDAAQGEDVGRARGGLVVAVPQPRQTRVVPEQAQTG